MTNNPNIDIERQNMSALATKQQRTAADPKKSVWVGASAGTGKTKVLSDRVMRLLLLGVNVSKILCLTYTKAAAVEMSSRVAEKLGKWAIISDDELEKELIKLYGDIPQDIEKRNKLIAKARQLFAVLLDTPGGIKIQTIHSFCQEILKRFPLEANVSPYFEVMDERTSLEAINNVKSHLLTIAGTDQNSKIGQAISYITDHISEYKFPDVINSIISNRSRIAQMIKNNGGSQNLLKNISEKTGIEDDLTLEKIILDFFEKQPKNELKELIHAGMEDLAPWAEGIAAPDTSDYKDYFLIFLTQKNDIRSVSKNKILNKNEKLKEIFLKEGQRCLNTINKITSFRIYQSTKAVLLLADELLKGYEEFKNIHAKMDYSDMILLTKNLLENREAAQWVLYKLDGGIDNILIDEAQDTSPDQWAIIRSISAEFFADAENTRTIFAVGDRKQSIYSFQGADPDKFDEMREYFSKLTPNFEKVNLDVSFRSTPAILTAVNNLFANDTTKKGVTSEHENVQHIPFRIGEAGEVEFWDIIEPAEEKTDDEWAPPIKRINKTSTSSQMAKTIASKIKQMVCNGEILQSKNRPLQYGDFLILVRSRDSFCEELIRECKNLNINISGIDRVKLMEQIAVQDLVSLGKFLLFPDDDLSLAEILKSPLLALNDDDLLKLCYNRKSTLWNALLTNPEYSSVADQIKQLFNKVDFMRPFELYNYILSEMNGRKKFYERMGPEAEDGLDEFINLCLLFEQEHIPSLQNFIEWITSDDVEIKRELEQGKNNMVRMMTVHGSKGLQAPIVILPDTTKVPSYSRGAGLLWNDDIFLYPMSSDDYDDLCNKLHNRQTEKMLEEYRRLMYVAVTRAEDRMIFCGFRKKRESPENSWYNLFKNSFTKIAFPNKENNIWKYQSQQSFEVEKKEEKASTKDTPPIPAFLHQPAMPEQPLSKPLTPSKPDDEPAVISPLLIKNDSTFYKRGSIIHRLLQFLPDIAPNERCTKIDSFIRRKAPEFSDNDIKKISNEIISLLENPDFGAVFGENSKAEVPIMGEVNGKIISGQIDRLVIDKQQIIVVDFKTNRLAATNIKEVPTVYISQLGAYKDLLVKIYPHHSIKTYILWTNTANMMEIK